MPSPYELSLQNGNVVDIRAFNPLPPWCLEENISMQSHIHTHTHTHSRVCTCLLQSCPAFCNPIGYSVPGSSVHAILQARILEWVAMPFSMGSSQLRDWTCVSCIADRFFTHWTTWEVSTHTHTHTHTHARKFLEYLISCANLKTEQNIWFLHILGWSPN